MTTSYTSTLNGDQLRQLRQFQADNFLPDTERNRVFYELFKSELEVELAKAQEKWGVSIAEEVDVAKGVFANTVAENFHGKDYSGLRFGIKGAEITVREDYEKGGVRFTGTVEGYLGKAGRGNVSKGDGTRLERTFVGDPDDPKYRIPLDHVDELTITHSTPIITPLEGAKDSIRSMGELLKSTLHFQLEYRSMIPTGMLPEVYALHGPQAKR